MCKEHEGYDLATAGLLFGPAMTRSQMIAQMKRCVDERGQKTLEDTLRQSANMKIASKQGSARAPDM